MPTKTLKIPANLTRAAMLMEGMVDGKKSKRISISSDVPYLRYDWANDEPYYEVLSHAPGDVDESRLKAGLTALFNHERDCHLGRATTYNNDGHRMDVGNLEDIIWSESEMAQCKKKDVENGSLVGTSVGYSVDSRGEQIGEKDGIPVIKFKWTPYEFSFCTVEADITVGAGRTRDKEESLIEISIRTKETVDTPKKNANPETTPMADTPAPVAEQKPQVDAAAERKAAVAEFQARCKKIDAHTAAIKNEAWRKAVEIVANKHKDGEANFEEFRSDANNAISELTTKADIEDDSTRSHIEVIGERRQNGHRALSVGAQFIRSKDFQERGKQTGRRRVITVDTDMSVMGIRGKVQLAQRAGFNSSDLTAINVAPQQQMIALGMERLTIMDLISPGTTSAAAIPYPKETSQGTLDGVAVTAGMPRAGNVGERGLKPTWEPDITTDTANVKKIAVVTKVPDEFLSDFPGFQSYIDARLPAMVDFQAENQILYGDGVGNNIKGILTNAGTLGRAYATNWFTTIRKAITDIEATSFFTVDAIAMHPYDWETASLELDANNQPYAGGPFYIPYGNGVFMEMRTFWGKPVVVTVAVTVGQPVIGCWKLGAQYFMREGMRIETTNANEDDFKRNLIALRAEERLALATYRPSCFLEVTGGPART